MTHERLGHRDAVRLPTEKAGAGGWNRGGRGKSDAGKWKLLLFGLRETLRGGGEHFAPVFIVLRRSLVVGEVSIVTKNIVTLREIDL